VAAEHGAPAAQNTAKNRILIYVQDHPQTAEGLLLHHSNEAFIPGLWMF
jgi:hypothetical protein